MLSPGSLYIYLINCEEIGDIDAQEAVPPVNTRPVRKFLSYLLLFSSFFPSGFFLLFALCFAQKKKKKVTLKAAANSFQLYVLHPLANRRR